MFDTKRGQGIVFNILVFDPIMKAESVYSPVVTYGCSFTAKVDGCDSFGMFRFTLFYVTTECCKKCQSLVVNCRLYPRNWTNSWEFVAILNKYEVRVRD